MADPQCVENHAVFETHTVFNQVPPLEDIDLFACDRPLQEAVAANGGAQDAPALSAFGRHWGSATMLAQARLANVNPPQLFTFDAQGRRRDVVEFHPAYHAFMTDSIRAGLHASTWNADGAAAAAPSEVMRAARFYMVAQIENGHMCPVTMTRAAVAALAVEPALAAMLMPKILSRDYDSRFMPWGEKTGITIGMGMTEKQGGTDVRANTTRAFADGDAYRITGHKWFMSAPMSDAFLVLAQASGGLTCFFMPRFRPNGSVNALRFQRLKDKLGNRSNASSEVEFFDAYALRVGGEGDGIRTILRMVQLTRMDCALASAGMMRMALVQALHHARHRFVFKKPLAEQPMMRAVLADMALEVEAAVALVMRLCRSFDLAATDPLEAARARLLTPVAKYWICKTAPAFIYEAMECLGGNGYVEESPLPRLYREAPVNAIWEGSGNVMCLDVLRAFARDPSARDVLMTLAREAKDVPGAMAAAERIAVLLKSDAEESGRALTGQLALLSAAAALNSTMPAIAENFGSARFVNNPNNSYGIDAHPNTNSILDRALTNE